MAAVLVLPPEILVIIGSEAEPDEVTEGGWILVESVRELVKDVVELELGPIVEIVLGNASGFPIPRPRQETNQKMDERSDLRPMAIATVSL